MKDVDLHLCGHSKPPELTPVRSRGTRAGARVLPMAGPIGQFRCARSFHSLQGGSAEPGLAAPK